MWPGPDPVSTHGEGGSRVFGSQVGEPMGTEGSGV